MAFSGGAGLGGPRGGGGRGGNGNRGFAPGRAPLPHGPGNHGGGRGGRGRGQGNRGGGGRHGAGARGPHVPAYLDPSQLLTGKALQQGAHAIANAQTQGPISMLAQQIASNNQTSANQQATDFGYYMQLAQAAKNAVSQQQQINQGLTGQLQGIGQQTQQQLGTLGQQAQGGAVGRMNALGLGGDSQQQLQDLTNQQKGLAAQNAQTYQQAGATQGANYQSMANSQQGVTGLAGEEQIGNLARANSLNNQKLNQQIGALQATRGADYATALGQLRTAERNYQIAQAGLGLKGAQIRSTAALDRARIGAEIRGQNVTLRDTQIRSKTSLAEAAARNAITKQNDLANQASKAASLAEKRSHDAATVAERQQADQALASYRHMENVIRANAAAAKSGGGVTYMTPHEQQTYFNDIDEIKGLIINGRKSNQSAQAIHSFLLTGQNPSHHAFPQFLIDAAYELMGWGYITQGTANQLRQAGLNPQGRFKIVNRGNLTRSKPPGHPG